MMHYSSDQSVLGDVYFYRYTLACHVYIWYVLVVQLMCACWSHLGLILVEEPYFNEAGYEKYKHSAEGAENSRMYNEMVLINMLQSLERLWKNPPETFREEVRQHLSKHLPK